MKRVMDIMASQSSVKRFPNARQQLKQYRWQAKQYLGDLIVEQPIKAVILITAVVLIVVAGITKLVFMGLEPQNSISLTQAMFIMALVTLLLTPAQVMLMAHFIRKIRLLRYKLARQLQTDSLTQLHSRQFFVNMVNELLDEQAYSHSCMSLMIIDVDHFRQIVDRYGLTESDGYLRQIATIGRGVLRSTDVACRFSTNRIAVLLRDTTMSEARVLGERMRQRIASEFAHLELPITISGGVASYSSSVNLTHWIQSVERLVNDAKSTGGNCVRAASQTRVDLQSLLHS